MASSVERQALKRRKRKRSERGRDTLFPFPVPILYPVLNLAASGQVCVFDLFNLRSDLHSPPFSDPSTERAFIARQILRRTKRKFPLFVPLLSQVPASH
ncbi:hypothetical protein LOK49_LG12G02921 [Camellia lanceoleosa]|uniref:Uncharacterized protein n=1 Tax=Camellia lanceoleosa TaxID=1840588 RepID=A0ACC0FSY2_9ERIC|nr:hypothetical protein LOK49_LG12G02921 [Camellia lanceoleosa]